MYLKAHDKVIQLVAYVCSYSGTWPSEQERSALSPVIEGLAVWLTVERDP